MKSLQTKKVMTEPIVPKNDQEPQAEHHLSESLTITSAQLNEFSEWTKALTIGDLKAIASTVNATIGRRVAAAKQAEKEKAAAIEERKANEYDDSLEAAIAYLASQCDGASKDDGKGFNAFHAPKGHKLAAAAGEWTKADAKTAYAIAKHYYGQVSDADLELPAVLEPTLWQYADDAKESKKRVVIEPANNDRRQRASARCASIGGLEEDKDRVIAVYEALPIKDELKKMDPYPHYDPSTYTWVFPLTPDSVNNITQFVGDSYDIDINLWEYAEKFEIRRLEWDQAEVARQLAAAESLVEQERIKAIARAEEEKKLAAIAEEKQAQQKAMNDEYIRLMDAIDLNATVGRSTMKLYQHQKAGVEWLLATRRDGYSGRILADKVGVGKTLQALVAASVINKVLGHKIVVIAPTSLQDNWMREASRIGVEIECFTWAAMPIGRAVGSYVLIADEAHRAKNPKTSRTKNLLHLASQENCYATFLLTGTPYPNGRAAEIFPMLQTCSHPLAVGERGDGKIAVMDGGKEKLVKCLQVFKNQYGRGKSQMSNGDELALLISSVLMQRAKKDCPDLPQAGVGKPVRVFPEVVPYAEEAASYQAEIAEYVREFRLRAEVRSGLVNHLFEDAKAANEQGLATFDFPSTLIEDDKGGFKPTLSNIPAAADDASGLIKGKFYQSEMVPMDAEEGFKMAGRLVAKAEQFAEAETLVTFSRMRKLASMYKVPHTVSAAIEVIKDQGCVIVVGQFNESLHAIAKGIHDDGYKVALYTGDTKPSERDRIIREFQDGELHAIVGNGKTIGEGLTLTAAATLILHQRDWRPGDAEQAEGRIYRIGQERGVTFVWPQWMCPVAGDVDNPDDAFIIDPYIDEMISKKSDAIAKLMEGKRKTATVRGMSNEKDYAKFLIDKIADAAKG